MKNTLALLLAMLMAASPSLPAAEEETPELRTKRALHAVQLGLERYAVDADNFYPDSIDTLLVQGYLRYGELKNAYTGEPLRDVPFGWNEQATGNYTYLKRYDETGRVYAYVLTAYGATLEPSFDLTADGVGDGPIHMLASLHPQPGIANAEEPWRDFFSHGELLWLTFGE